mmetsp:Transcript_57628/g.160583  ORF Transcript_57628/g.160583 Transcript_57628/m.160583 type:complete len:309 (+) Transcript_57628:949-1875(+)
MAPETMPQWLRASVTLPRRMSCCSHSPSSEALVSVATARPRAATSVEAIGMLASSERYTSSSSRAARLRTTASVSLPSNATSASCMPRVVRILAGGGATACTTRSIAKPQAVGWADATSPQSQTHRRFSPRSSAIPEPASSWVLEASSAHKPRKPDSALTASTYPGSQRSLARSNPTTRRTKISGDRNSALRSRFLSSARLGSMKVCTAGPSNPRKSNSGTNRTDGGVTCTSALPEAPSPSTTSDLVSFAACAAAASCAMPWSSRTSCNVLLQAASLRTTSSKAALALSRKSANESLASCEVASLGRT